MPRPQPTVPPACAAAIRSAFEAIFANGVVNAQPEKVRRSQTQGCAVHSVLEHIRIHAAQGWRLVSHHAGPGSPRELQEIVGFATVLH